MNVPVTLRNVGVRLPVPVTENDGAAPCTLSSARLWSPSPANAALRIASILEVRFCREAIVKSQASYRFQREIPARSRARKIRA